MTAALAELAPTVDAIVATERRALAVPIVLGTIPAAMCRIGKRDWTVAEHENTWRVFLDIPDGQITEAACKHVSQRLGLLWSSATWFMDLARSAAQSHESLTEPQIAQLVDIICQTAAKRRLSHALIEASARLDAGTATLAEVAPDVRRDVRLAEATIALPGEIPPRASEIAPALWAQPFPLAIPSGSTELDGLLGGGFRDCSLIAAPTGKGKTGFAIQIGRQTARQQPVCYFSTELSKRQALARFAAPELGRSWREVFEAGPDAGTAVAVALADLDLRIFEVRDVQEIFAVLRDLTSCLKRPIFSIIDYIQGLARGAEADRRLALGALSDGLTRSSRETGSTSLIVSSVARSMYHGNADKSAGDFVGAAKESGDLEFDAANVLFLDVDPCPMGGTSSGRLHVAKSRFGVQGTVGLRFDGARGTFTEDALGSLTDEQRDVYDAIADGANTYAEVAKVVERRKQDVCRIVGVLERRSIIGTRPLRIGCTP